MHDASSFSKYADVVSKAVMDASQIAAAILRDLGSRRWRRRQIPLAVWTYCRAMAYRLLAKRASKSMPQSLLPLNIRCRFNHSDNDDSDPAQYDAQ